MVGWARELPRAARRSPSWSNCRRRKRPNRKRARSARPSPIISGTARRSSERDLRELFRVGWRSLLIGLVVLIVCLVGSQVVAKMIGNAVVARVLEESLIIVGWVANWRPLEIYLYDWWPIRRRILLYRRVAAAPVQVRPA